MTWTARARGRVSTAYTAQYADPISLGRGETITVTERREPWRDNPAWLWVWCEDARGKSGWVPEGAFERRGEGVGVGLRDYSAVELSVAPGPLVEAPSPATRGLGRLAATRRPSPHPPRLTIPPTRATPHPDQGARRATSLPL